MNIKRFMLSGLASVVLATPILGQEGGESAQSTDPYSTFRGEIVVALRDSLSADNLVYTMDMENYVRVTWEDNGVVYGYGVLFEDPHTVSFTHHVLDNQAIQSHAVFENGTLQYGHGPKEQFGALLTGDQSPEETEYMQQMIKETTRSLWMRLHAPQKRN